MTLGAPRKTVCSRGHDMSATRRVYPNGDTYCSAFKQIRHEEFCRNHPERNRVYRTNSRRRTVYGMEPDEYAIMLESQFGTCAICGRPPKSRSLHVDHDHATGDIRGLLCHNCNTAIGLLGDDIAIMSRAVEYLSRHPAMRMAGKRRKR